MATSVIGKSALAGHSQSGLSRRLSLPMALLFGLGVTIGAGVYVLIGATVGRAGVYAPLAFALAAIVMAPTAASFAELATRYPVSAGEAAYVEAGFGSRWLAFSVGCLVVATAVFSAGAVAVGSAGYLQALMPLPSTLLVSAIVVSMGAIAAWGILQSSTFIAGLTLIEVGGLLVVIVAGFLHAPNVAATVVSPTTVLAISVPWSGVLSATMLAFFAFVGFEGLANIAEEVKNPTWTLPRAIALTLVISTTLYILIAWIALRSVSQVELAASTAPLSLVFERVTDASPVIISLIAVVATANGIVVQIIMAARVLFGLADRGLMPRQLAAVNATTQTPLLATALATIAVLALALMFPIENLADTTSRLTLIVFAFVNVALVLLKRKHVPLKAQTFQVPLWVPVTGSALCLGLLLLTLLL